ncbi:hypothetical protein C5167_037409 [Papaver somniferum]|uniref:Uncharacterized protein n=1 Tax=Papaver somniferum TaxID=3469 RepID=A0A4Y7I6M3_PAPSO|nr:hypothetical protein C5167_037409 [Papaver somniferum]
MLNMHFGGNSTMFWNMEYWKAGPVVYDSQIPIGAILENVAAVKCNLFVTSYGPCSRKWKGGGYGVSTTQCSWVHS